MCTLENNQINDNWSYQKLNDVTAETQSAILHFSLLWSLFESKFCNESANATSIFNKSRDLQELLKLNNFDRFLDYFQKRYITGGVTNQMFENLNFRRNDNKALVLKVLKSETESIVDIVSALLIIVYRLRNNLFHGLKWQYNIEDQYNNFDISNQLLILVLPTVDI